MSKQKIEIGIEDVLLTVQFNQFGWWVSSGGERILRMDDAETAAFCELQDRLWTAATACPETTTSSTGPPCSRWSSA